MQRMMRLTIHLSNGKIVEYHPAAEGGKRAEELRARATQVDVDSGWIDWQPDYLHNNDGRFEALRETLKSDLIDKADRERILAQHGHEG